jgi:hypothetical protein
LNTAKTGYTEALVSANSSVAANTAKTGYTEALVSANSTVVSHATKHGEHEVAIPLRALKANGVHTGDSQFDTIGINTSTPNTKLHVAYTSASDKGAYIGQGTNHDSAHQADFHARTLTLGSRPNGAWATLGFQVQSTDKAAIDYNAGTMDFYIYDNAAGAWDKALSLQKDGQATVQRLNINYSNLPNAIVGLSSGDLYRDSNNFLKIVP